MSNPIPQIVAELDDIIGRHRGSEWAMIDTCYLMTLRDALSDLVHIPTDIDDLTKMGLNPNTKYGQIYVFLSRHPERIVPAEDLMEIAEVTSKRALWIYIYRIRERLAEHAPGVSLETHHGIGYRLTCHPRTEEPKREQSKHMFRSILWCDCGREALYRAGFDVPGRRREKLELCERCLSMLLEDHPDATVAGIVYGEEATA